MTEIRDAGPYAYNVHPQVWLDHAGGGGAHVDEELVPLIRSLWRLGLVTVASCQSQDFGTGPMAWIGFASMRDVDRMIEIVGDTPHEVVVPNEADRAAGGDGYDTAGGVLFPTETIDAVTRRASGLATTKPKKRRSTRPKRGR